MSQSSSMANLTLDHCTQPKIIKSLHKLAEPIHTDDVAQIDSPRVTVAAKHITSFVEDLIFPSRILWQVWETVGTVQDEECVNFLCTGKGSHATNPK
ncbi:hypothetical protein IAQ61_000947 [Plenodomus lingam]|uniref:uncharacterized protein n=1 Tax=Leptosphaeria maculans TaxID=5022 RepID=UPI0033275B59|nr:hypothetical protein IAQ61_000947 [Plenodomus lingam]